MWTIFTNIDCCQNKSCDKSRLGHSITCIDNPDCPSILRCLRELGSHYSGVRSFMQHVYICKALVDTINKFDMTLATCNLKQIEIATDDLKKLTHKETSTVASSEKSIYEVRPIIDEELLLKTYRNSFVKCHADINTFH